MPDDRTRPDVELQHLPDGTVAFVAHRSGDNIVPFDPERVPSSDEPPAPVPAQISATPPRVHFAHGACVIDWKAPHYVRLELDRFVNARDELTAELVARYTAPGLEHQIYQARVNLMGPRARTELVNALSKKRKDIEWADVIEIGITAAVRAYRDGEPAILLRDAPVRLATPYLLYPILLAEFPTIVFGRGGDGKSLLALAMALALHTGRADIVGLRPARQVRVLFLDWEFSASEHRERMAAMLLGAAQLPDIAYLRCSESIWDSVDRIQRAIRDHGAEYLVVDSVAMACGGIPPETSEAALRFNTALRRLALGALCVAHTVKDAASEDYPFGSIFWHNSARSTWLVRRETDAGARPETFALYHKKANVGPRLAPVPFEVDIDADERYRIRQISIARRDPGDVAAVAEKQPTQVRMARALRTGPRSFVELAEELDAKVDTIERTFRRYDGKLFTQVHSTDGIYRIANLAREAGA